MDNEKLVNINKVAKSVLAIGQFGLFQLNDVNLIATHWFMLSVNEEQFWKIQCKLEARKKNVWLVKSKEGLRECMGSSAEDTYALYCNLVYEQAREIYSTLLTYNGIKLFADPVRYFGILAHHLEMIDYPPTIKNTPGRESVIVDDVHIFTAVKKENTDWKYLRPLGE